MREPTMVEESGRSGSSDGAFPSSALIRLCGAAVW